MEAPEPTADDSPATTPSSSCDETGGLVRRFGTRTARRSPTRARVLHVALAYNSIHAGQRAVRMLDALSHDAGDRVALHPVVWRFEHLEDPHWHYVATSDAKSAELLIIAVDDAAALSWCVTDWLRASLDRRRETKPTVVVLHENGQQRANRMHPRLEAIHSLTKASGARFFAPAPQDNEHRLLSPVYADGSWGNNHESWLHRAP